MHLHLAQYLKDHKEHILEHWITEADVPSMTHCNCSSQSEGIIPLSYLEYSLGQVIHHLEIGHFNTHLANETHLNDFLGHTCVCRDNTRVCTEIRDSGYVAILSIFSSDWDADHEFDDIDREYASNRIGQILTEFFKSEITLCAEAQDRRDCPFRTGHN